MIEETAAVPEATEQDDGDEGPIILPPNAACSRCHYSAQVRQGNSIQAVRICRRFPPNAIFMANAQGGMLTSQPPIVPDDYSCFEYDEREGGIIPTGLG